MILKWERDRGILYLNDGGLMIHVTCNVRNEIDPKYVRRLHEPKEVVKTVVGGQWGPPYMPRKFPLGKWEITSIEYSDDPEFAPIKIRTKAEQYVTTWILDEAGGYDHASDRAVKDSGYHFHFCKPFRTTLGCGRVGGDDASEIAVLAAVIASAWGQDEEVYVEVV